MYGISYYNDKDNFSICIKFHVSLTYYALRFSYVWLYDNIRDDYNFHAGKLFSFYKQTIFRRNTSKYRNGGWYELFIGFMCG